MTYDVNTLSVARLFEYHPDWSAGYEVTRSFLTDVITSRNNTEQRRALRDVPRVSARYKAVVQDSDLRALNHFLRARQNDPVAVPDFSRHALTTGASSGGDTTLTLASPPAWIAAGFLAVLCGSTVELVRITNVAGSTITLAAALDNAWPSGSVLRPALHGLLSGQLAGPRYHRGAAALAVDVSAYPGGEPIEDEGAADATFGDYEVFPRLEPDWSGQPALNYLWPVERVDYGIGRTAQFRPIDLAQRLTEAEFNLAKADAVVLEQFFLRMKGRRGAFWRATGEQDFVLADTASSGSSAFLDEGTDLADDFGAVDYAVQPAAIEVVLTDGTRLHRLVTGIAESSGDSEVTVDEAWPGDLTAETVARISWMPLVRLAADDLTTLWRTPVQAQIRTSFQSIRVVVPVADTTAPTITSDDAISVPEDSTLGLALSADEFVTWSIVGGVDAAEFSISGGVLHWVANGTKDYEAPDDADANNVYLVTVRATDGSGNYSEQTITVTVTDLDQWQTVSTVNLNSKIHGGSTPAVGLTAGITLGVFSPSDVLRLTMPSGGTYVAYSVWGRPSPLSLTPPGSGSVHKFKVIPDGNTAGAYQVGSSTVYDGYEAARAAFGTQTITGASSYTFYIEDTPLSDNTGGLSILVERLT